MCVRIHPHDIHSCVGRRGNNMTAVAISALFSIVAVVVGLVLIDSTMKFYSAAKTIQRSAQADRLAGVSQETIAKSTNGIITAVRIMPTAPASTARRGVHQRSAPRFKAPAARHVAA